MIRVVDADNGTPLMTSHTYDGTDWRITEEGDLHVMRGALVVAHFPPGTWHHVERVAYLK